jgi:hypothetical protein
MAIRRKRGWFCTGVLASASVAIVLSLSTAARAELVAADTANAMAGWYGTKTVQFFEESNSKYVDGSVDYAVYAPGQFNLSFPGEDPSGGTQYVYRFQLYNASTSEDYLKKLTVGLVNISSAAGWFCTWVEPGPLYAAGGVTPSSSQVGFVGTPPTSVNWGYKSSAPVTAGNYSKMLIFTSAYGPTLQSATIYSTSTIQHWVDGGGSQYNWWEGTLPSPAVPEPSTLFSLLVSAGLFVIYRRFRCK